MTMLRRLRVFSRSTKGAVTVEFVISFTLVFTMLMVIFELFFLMLRSTMLQRALDLTVREIRLGEYVNPTVGDMETVICNRMIALPDCDTSLTLEFTVIDKATFAMPGQVAPCVLRQPDVNGGRIAQPYNTGLENDLMVVRACVVADTITPVFSDAFTLFARSAFVNEPDD
ncbi:MAG: hypothetical protein RL216_3465 [Pseudomonadota bacterium]|jgi:hypothetical protein